MAGLLDILTGGKSADATEAQKNALAALQGVQTPSYAQLSLPELQKYAVAQNMTPAQMQAFLQQNNAYNTENVGQQGTAAQVAAINQLAGVANAGAEGSPTQRAQIEQVNQDAARNLAGQRGAIDQQAQARGVSPGMLQAALGQVQAGQGQQDAHMAALQAQGQNYQQALSAMASGAGAGQALQGQQNTQANTVAQAQNAMQQFNAANQQAASGTNAGMQQQANMQNTQNANQTAAANTGLANQRTQYNAALPQQMFGNEMQKAGGVANQYGNIANTATQQGQQTAGIYGGLIGAGATALGGPAAGAAANGAMSGYAPPASANTQQYAPAGVRTGYAKGGVVQPYAQGGEVMAYHPTPSAPQGGGGGGHNNNLTNILMALGGAAGLATPFLMKKFGASSSPNPDMHKDVNSSLGAFKPDPNTQAMSGGGMVGHEKCFHDGGLCLTGGGFVPGKPKVSGDSLKNDTVPARLSPGEAVLPRTTVQQNPAMVQQLLRRGTPPPVGHHPQDIASLLAAMKHMRGAA